METRALHRSVIERLRLKGGADPTLARLRAESVLGAIDLRPPGLPPSAILMVRALRVSGGSTLDRAVDGTTLQRWERALVDALSARLRVAARPAFEAASGEAEAVLFTDRAELLACLARDVCRGVAGARWWWRGALAGEAPREAAVRAWTAAPEHAPSAWAQLERSGDAWAFVALWTADEARVALTRVLEARGLHPVAALLAAAPDDALRSRPALGRGEVMAPPWPGDAHEDARALVALGSPRVALVGVARALVRAPETVRAESFLTRARRWVAASEEPRGELAPPAPPEPARRQGAAAPPAEPPTPSLVGTTAVVDAQRVVRDVPEAPVEAPTPRSFVHEPSGAPEVRVEAWARAEARAPSVQGAAHAEANDRAPASAAAAEEAAPDAPPTDDVAPTTEEGAARVADGRLVDPSVAAGRRRAEATALAEGTVVETALGGVFFLVLVGMQLGLYGDFSAPRAPGIPLPLWDWLALMGRALLGDGYDDDALWPLLAALAGRGEGEAPGEGYEPPTPWAVEEPWRSEDAPERCHGERAVDRWIAWLAPQVRRRLAEALGVAGGEVGATLLVLPARVRVTGAHLDVMMALADLPIEVRRAGIDRDVGWVPAAGKYVAFQFE